MKITPHINEEDTIRIVRIVVKCSDMLSDFDVLEEYMINKKTKYIKHEVKAPFKVLGSYVDKFSSAFLKPFVEADDTTQMELQSIFSEFSSKIYIKDDETTALAMLYAKCKSICEDIVEMKYGDKRLKDLLKYCMDFYKAVEKKFPLTITIEDKHGHGFDDIANGLSRLGKTIMYGTKTPKNV
jgi:hypothetical protein